MGKPIMLYAYGSYGHSMDAYFHQQDYPYSTEVLFMPLRIRGGEDLGRQWYEGGKLLKEKFKDFIACSTYLIDQNILLQHICMLKVDLLVDY
jgi:oligopeptidase B